MIAKDKEKSRACVYARVRRGKFDGRGRAGGREETDACNHSFFEKQLLSIKETGESNVFVYACMCVIWVCPTQKREKERGRRSKKRGKRDVVGWLCSFH